LPLYETLGEHTALILVWPFDYAHILYAMAVRFGFLKDSMLVCRLYDGTSVEQHRQAYLTIVRQSNRRLPTEIGYPKPAHRA
jgi:hypothetical protein